MLCKQRISQKVGERMRAAVGFRNIAVHDYESIDWQIVYHALNEVGKSN